jgi:hypothetical protein
MKKQVTTILAAIAVALGSLGVSSCGYPDYNADHYYHHTAHAPYGNYYHYEHQGESLTGKNRWRYDRPFGSAASAPDHRVQYPYVSHTLVR